MSLHMLVIQLADEVDREWWGGGEEQKGLWYNVLVLAATGGQGS